MQYVLTSTKNRNFDVSYKFENKIITSANEAQILLNSLEFITASGINENRVMQLHGTVQKGYEFANLVTRSVVGTAYNLDRTTERRMLLSHNLFPIVVGENRGYATLFELLQCVDKTGDVSRRPLDLAGDWHGSIGFARSENFKAIREKFSLHYYAEFYPHTELSFADVVGKNYGVEWRPFTANVKKV